MTTAREVTLLGLTLLAGVLGGSVLTWRELRAVADTGGIRSSPGRTGGP